MSEKRQGGPRKRASRKPQDTQLYFNIEGYQQSFDKEAFSALVRSQGVKLVHYKAIPDPSGMASIGDIHAVQSQRSSSDGFIYKKAGTILGFFSGNSSNFQLENEGFIKTDSAVITLPDYYEDCPDKEVMVAPYDRFFLADIETRTIASQYVEASVLGVDKLQYPATCVEFLIDADGIEYEEGKHFEITQDGFIKWTSQQRPVFNEKTLKGTVYSIRYRYTPYFVIIRLLHEIRVTNITDPNTYERKLERMPYQVLVMREHVLSDQNRSPLDNMTDMRYQNAPPVAGVTGPSDDNSDGGML
jgi:hypothetical protein